MAKMNVEKLEAAAENFWDEAAIHLNRAYALVEQGEKVPGICRLEKNVKGVKEE